MELDAMIRHFGEPVSMPGLVAYFAGIGVDLNDELVLPEGEFDAYVERPQEGYCAVFTDETMFLGLGNQSLGEGPLYLSGVFLYAGGKDGYDKYTGQLPFGMTFLRVRDEILTTLGPPSWQNQRDDGTVLAERWDNKAEFRIHITYSRTTGMPSVISLSRPNTPL